MTQMKSKGVFFLMVLFSFISISNGIKIESAYYELFDHNVLGSTYTWGFITVKFDEELYRVESLECDVGCTLPEEGCYPCDFRTDCGVITPDYCNSTDYYCTPIQNFIACQYIPNMLVLEPGDEFEYQLPTGDAIYIVVHNSEPCTALRIQNFLDTGDPDVFLISPLSPEFYSGSPYTTDENWGPERTTICPPYSYGSFYYILYSYRASSGKLIITSHDVSQEDYPTTSLSILDNPLPPLVPKNRYLFSDLLTSSIHSGVLLDVYEGCYNYLLFLSNPNVKISVSKLDDPLWKLDMTPNEMERNFQICKTDKDSNPMFNLTMQWIIDLTDVMTITFISSKDLPSYFFNRNILDYPVYTFPYYTMGDVDLVCNGDYRTCSGGRDRSCTHFQSVAANHPPAIFWPLPTLVLSRSSKAVSLWNNDEYFLPSYFDGSNRMNDTLQFFYLLRYDQDGRVRIFKYDDIMETCSLRFHRGPTNSEGVWINDTVLFVGNKKEADCNYEALEKFVSEALDFFDNMNNKSGQELTNARFELDVWAMSQEYTDCLSYHEEYLSEVTTVVETRYDTDCAILFNDPSFFTDPCCNTLLQWDRLCLARNYTISANVYTQRTEIINEECINPECVSGLSLDNYFKLKSQAKNQEDGCRSVTPASFAFYLDQLEPFTNCMIKHIFYPQRCLNDSSCEFGERCDITTFTCLVSAEQREKNFFQCLWNDLDPFIKQDVTKQLGIPSNTSALDILPYFYSRDCRGDYWLSVPGRSGVSLEAQSSPQCDFGASILSGGYEYFCLDESCWSPGEFDWKGDCERIWKPVTLNATLCTEETYCNWNPDITCAPDDQDCIESCQKTNTTDEYFCGWCENGMDCFEIPGLTEQQCSQQNICVHPDGTVSAESEEQCSQVRGCSRICFDPVEWKYYPCANQQECETRGGRCVMEEVVPEDARGNWDHNIFGNEDFPLVYEYTPLPTHENGMCLIQPVSMAFERVNCPAQPIPGLYLKTTQLGCLGFTENEANCTMYQGTWVTKHAQSEQECKDMYGKVCRERASSFNFVQAFLNDIQLNGKNEEDCLAVEADWDDYFTWLPGHWTQGVSRTPQWIKREYKPRNTVTDSTLSISYLRTILESSIDAKLGYSVKTEAYCLYREMFGVVETTGCDCLNTGEENCFSQTNAIILAGVTVVCSGRKSSAVFPPNRLEFASSTIPSKYECQDLSVYVRDVSLLESPKQSSSLSTTLFSFDQETSYSFSFKNSHSSFVGQILGNGIKLTVSSNLAVLENVTICSTVNYEFDIKNSYKYADFALLVNFDDSRLDPTNTHVTLTEKEEGGLQLCATFSEIKVNATYVPVYRMDNWEDEDSSSWSTGELFGGYLLACLYLLLFFFGLFELKYLMGLTKANITRIRQRYLVIILMVFSGLRALYFFLLMSGALDDADSTVDYFLIDFVTILFFSSFITYLLYMWVNALFATSSIRQYLTQLAIAINLVIYLFFGAMIIAYEVTGSTNDEYWCGQLRSSTDDTSTQDSIKLAYRIVLACVAFTIGVAFFWVGLSLLKSLGGSGNRTQSRKDDQMKRMLLNMTITISISFILQSIFFLVVELLEISDMAFTVPLLIVVEITPCAVILYSLRPKDIDNKTQSTQSASL